MEHSDSVQKIAAALCKVQAKLKPLKKNAENPAFKRGGKVAGYLDLAGLCEVALPMLAAEGLAISQGCDGYSLETLIMHDSGEWLLYAAPLPHIDDPQRFTAAITYFRRSGIASAVGVSTEGEDDDGNYASDPQSRPSAPPPASRPVGPGPRPETAPATPVPASGGSPALFVKSVDKTAGEKNGKAWTRYSITFSDGRKASTFSETEGRVAENAKSQGAAVVAGFEQKGQYLNLISLKFAGEPGPDEMPDDDSVPF